MVWSSSVGSICGWYAQPGFHIVNKLGQVMNRKPWSDSTRNAIDFLDDLDHRPDKLPW
jgi:hypothetical protein